MIPSIMNPASIVVYIALVTEFVIRFHYDLPISGSENTSNKRLRIEDGYPFSPIYAGKPTLVRVHNLEKRRLTALHWKLQLLLVGGGISVICILIR